MTLSAEETFVLTAVVNAVFKSPEDPQRPALIGVLDGTWTVVDGVATPPPVPVDVPPVDVPPVDVPPSGGATFTQADIDAAVAAQKAADDAANQAEEAAESNPATG
jgi:hypothetical protein